MTVTVALDAMGGDHGAAVVVPAALRVARMRDDLRLILVGDSARIEPYLASVPAALRERSIGLQHASQTVDMDEPPAQAMRTKKDSSMRVAVDLVKHGEAAACVSAGNTGALMATARFVLKTLPGIDRPAICSALPTIDGITHMLDLGANVECTADHLVQFAVMGASLVTAVHHIAHPRVGLLNIGEEDIKGNELIKQAGRALEDSALNYVGYVEGHNVYKGAADVVVCDGFSGNIALKSSEGVAHLVANFMKQEFERNLLTRLAGLAALPVLRSLKRRLDPRGYNGGVFVGLRGVVVKSHGSADSYSFGNAIIAAADAVTGDLTARIEAQLGGTLDQAVAG